MIKDTLDKMLVLNEDGVLPREVSPLALAYIGDAVYEMIVRTYSISLGNAPANKLHKKSRELVNASAQHQIFEKLKDALDEEEMAVFKRGRNAKSFTMPKNASMADYRYATGLEALFGYLYLSGRQERILELFRIGVLSND